MCDVEKEGGIKCLCRPDLSGPLCCLVAIQCKNKSGISSIMLLLQSAKIMDHTVF